MARRYSKNTTGIPRIPGIPPHDAWVSYTCINCGTRNYEKIGSELLRPTDAYSNCDWKCTPCKFSHNKSSNLPFENWASHTTVKDGLPTQRFWQAFFRSATEKPESYWKMCSVCDRVLPYADFSGHKRFGMLKRQIECRACKAAINGVLNIRRTPEQLRESSAKRRIADLLMAESVEKLDVKALFERFEYKCFKTKIELKIEESSAWQIDHTIPSRYFYPLTARNATLLSTSANQNKSGMWPSMFYTNKELVELARITGASLELLSSKDPIWNTDIDVNACVERYLDVRKDSDLSKRIAELKLVLDKHDLVDQLNEQNSALLGLRSSSW